MLSAIPGTQWKWSCLLAAGIILIAFTCYGQGDHGLISGVVRDPSVAVVPHATVSATNASTGLVVKAESNQQGVYTVGPLPAGVYAVAVEHTGFKRFDQIGVTVRVGDHLSLDIPLAIGSSSERVEVRTDASVLETANSSLGTVIDNRRIKDLSLLYGNPMMLEFLAPGIAFDGNLANQHPFDGTATSASVNGSQVGALEFRMDGVTDSPFKTAIAFQPSVEFIQEYKVETSAYDASQGHAAGGWVDISLKSGTNEIHGSGYGYLQNRALNANQFFTNLAGQGKPPITYDRVGGNAGGPIIRNRTFWFFGYEHLLQNSPEVTTLTVPTAAEKTGDFSQLLALGTSYQIYNPFTTTPAAGGRYTRTPFAGNIVPASLLTATGKAVAAYYPSPNLPGSSDGGNNFYYNGIVPERFYEISSRVDHSINPNQRIFGRFSASHRHNKGEYYFPPVTGDAYSTRHFGGVIDYLNTLNPQTVLEVRYGYTRYTLGYTMMSAPFDVTSIGMPASLDSPLTDANRRFPAFAPAGYTDFSSNYTASGKYYNTHSLIGNLSRAQGKHLLRGGIEYRGYQFNNYAPGLTTGYYTFGSSYVNGPFDNSATAPRGQGLAGMLLGIPSGGYIDNNDSFAGINSFIGTFIQDDWKVTSKLTLNLGLRYEYEGAPTERYNRSVLGFNFNTPNPIAAKAIAAYAANPIPQVPVSQFQVNGGLTYAGANGASNGLWSAPALNFMPRFGLAYMLTPRTVLRAGYGIFYDFLGTAAGWSPIQSGYSQQTPVVASTDNGVTYSSTINNPFPTGLLPIPGNKAGMSTFLGSSVSFWNQAPKTPYNQKWSVGIQRAFATNWLLDVSYVGERGTHLQTTRQLDGIPDQYLSTLTVRDQATINRLSAVVANPFAGLIPGTSLNNATVGTSQLLVVYPEFTGVTEITNQGYSWYHALQVKLEKRFAQGYTLMGTWTYGKNMEATQFLNAEDPVPYRSISTNDRTNRVVLNGIYELPFGKGRKFGAGWTGVAGKAIEGWQLTAVLQLQSGAPLGLGNFIYYGDASNIVLPMSQRTRLRWFNTAGFERSSSLQLASNLRYQPLLFSGLRSDMINILDFSLVKKTKITERTSVDFRCEFINALNHPIFNAPDTSETSSTFGQATSTVALARTIQAGLIFRF